MLLETWLPTAHPAIQRSFQALLPNMIQVIGQCVQESNEDGARKLFDVLETLLILVRDVFTERARAFLIMHLRPGSSHPK